MKKIYLVPIALVLLVVIFAPRFIKSSQTGTGNQQPKKTLTGLEIAKQSFTFLDKTIKPEGGFYFSFECNKNFDQVCRPREFYQAGHSSYKPSPHFGHLILSFYDYGKKTGDSSYIDKANKAMEFVMTSCDQDTNWCIWNFSPLIAYYNDTKDERYKNAMLRASDEILKEKTPMEHLSLNSGLKLKALYDISKDQRYLSSLTNLADAIMAGEIDKDETNPPLYKEGDFTVRAQTFKSIWSTILPTYNATKDPKYLNFTKDSLTKANITGHFGKFQTSEELQHLIFALDSYLQLTILDATNKDAHHKMAHDIAQHIYSTYADTPENNKFNGDYGFVENGIKDSLNNGWLTRHFVKLSDDTFNVN